MINYTASPNEIIQQHHHNDDNNNVQWINLTQEISSLRDQLQSLTQQLQQFQNIITNKDKNVCFSNDTKNTNIIPWVPNSYNNQNMQQRYNNNIQTFQSKFNNNRHNNNTYQQYRTYYNNNGAQYNRVNAKKYCWTHGACSHDGTECQTPAVGHQPYATFRNRLNGNNDGCIIKKGRRFNRHQNWYNSNNILHSANPVPPNDAS